MERPVDNLLGAISLPQAHRMHFLDIENLAGSGLLTAELVHSICRKYIDTARAESNDVFFLAAGPQNKTAAFEGWDWGVRFFQFRKGKDGADNALVSFYESISQVEKFDHVFVASGDHSLATIAEGASAKGIQVTVVTGKGKQSGSLRRFPSIRLGLVAQEAA